MAYKQNGQLIGTKRKVFISHYKGDKDEVEAFIKIFATEENVFIPKVLGVSDNDDFIESTDTDYVMTQIRKKYLDDSTVTIVLIGSCTHSRRYVDWELKTSFRQGNYTPNGVIGILLPSQGTSAHMPLRLKEHWSNIEECYVSYKSYPSTAKTLHDWIEDAYDARTSKAHLIKNSQEMMKYNGKCNECKVTH